MSGRNLLLLLADSLLVLLAFVISNELRSNFGFDVYSYLSLVPYLVFTMLVWSVASYNLRVSLSIWRFSSLAEYLKIVAACALTAVAAIGLTFVYNRMDGVPRALPVLHVIVASALLVGARVLLRLRQGMRHRTTLFDSDGFGTPAKTVLLVGVGPLAELYLRSLRETAMRNVHVAGVLALKAHQIDRQMSGLTVLGVPETAEAVIRDLGVHGVHVDEIVVTVDSNRLSEAAKQALDTVASSTDVRLRFLATELVFGEERSDNLPLAATERLGGSFVRKMLQQSPNALSTREIADIRRRPYWIAKRGLDILVATSLLAVLSPVILVVSIAVAVDLGAPIYFWQRRPGLGGRSFACLKFRSMRGAYDADGHIKPDSARTSVVGTVLRRLRLDELPQLLNVLFGDMSIVGPRPLLPVDQPKNANDRLLVRPGMTGWAQVCGGRDISPADKLSLDVWYIRNASLRLDALILLKTIGIVLGGERLEQAALEEADRAS
jgi:lipopolysaccharide/colanic/teichoic acid biosynthesis glycosyltransferase